jgi:hypothetical protein
MHQEAEKGLGFCRPKGDSGGCRWCEHGLLRRLCASGHELCFRPVSAREGFPAAPRSFVVRVGDEETEKESAAELVRVYFFFIDKSIDACLFGRSIPARPSPAQASLPVGLSSVFRFSLRPCLLLRYFYPRRIWVYVGIWCSPNTLKSPQILFPKNTLP